MTLVCWVMAISMTQVEPPSEGRRRSCSARRASSWRARCCYQARGAHGVARPTGIAAGRRGRNPATRRSVRSVADRDRLGRRGLARDAHLGVTVFLGAGSTRFEGELDAIVLRCLEKEQSARFTSALELRAAPRRCPLDDHGDSASAEAGGHATATNFVRTSPRGAGRAESAERARKPSAAPFRS